MNFTKDLFRKYAELKAVIKDAELQIKEINPMIRKELEDNKVDEVTSDDGKFYFTEVPVWTFPEEIQKLEESVEKMKDEAKKKGTAAKVMRIDLKFTPKKHE